MTSQLDLFGLAGVPKVPRTCGTCVVRNAVNEAQERGDCSRLGLSRHKDDPACPDWFGLGQLRAPLYGRKAAASLEPQANAK